MTGVGHWQPYDRSSRKAYSDSPNRSIGIQFHTASIFNFKNEFYFYEIEFFEL